ncbi:MAG: hypothetical protein JWP88_579 [Flaviaesturariibacter sp.]|nr:hypothetical protein [Flaviaesturariibacter sp.]
MDELFIRDFDYPLEGHQIAEFPLSSRDASKLLFYKDGDIQDAGFKELADFLPENATLILNNTRVIEARIHFQKETGGLIELFCLEPYEPSEIALAMEQTGAVQWRCLIGGASKWKAGQILEKRLVIEEEAVNLYATYIAKEEDSFIVRLSWNSKHTCAEILQAAGNIPLPPYIKRAAEATDSERYQTVFAAQKGSVAAPTAALHFTEGVFESLAQKGIQPAYITLHVGAGTFKPVKTETISEHLMHAESFSVTADLLRSLLAAKTIVAVGTTSLRTLESLYWLGVKLRSGNRDFTLSQWEAYELPGELNYAESLGGLVDELTRTGQQALHCRTSLLIRPNYRIRSADALITNFHQPKSTLLLLVAAFIGEEWKQVYDHALNHDYRFLSYGDSSLLWRKD